MGLLDPPVYSTTEADKRFATPADVAAFSLPRRLARPALSMLTDATTGITSTGAKVAAFDAAYAMKTPFGGTCARLVSSGAASGTVAQFRAQSLTWNLTGKQLVVFVKVTDLTHATGISIIVGDSTFANYFTFQPTGALNVSKNKYMRDGQIIPITVPWAPTLTGGTADAALRAAVTQFRVSIVDDGTGVPVEAFLCGVATMPEQSVYPNGVITLSFDDSYNMDHMVQKLGSKGYSATNFVVGSQVGLDSTRPTVGDYRMFVDALGWELAGHADSVTHHTDYPALSVADKTAYITAVRKWHVDNGFPTDIFAYPNGTSDAATDALVRRFFTAARGTGTAMETLPVGRPEYLRAFSASAGNATSAALNAYADKVKAAKAWGIVVFHAVYESGTDPSSGLGTTWANFDAFIDYIATTGIAVETMGRVLQRF